MKGGVLLHVSVERRIEPLRRDVDEAATLTPGEVAAAEQAEGQVSVAEALGARIRGWRQRRGLTVRQLASQCGVTPGFISQVERGLANPSLGSLYQIGRALGVPVEMFFREDGAAGSASGGAETSAAISTRAGPVVRLAERRHLNLGGGIHWAKLSPDEDSPHEFLEIVMDVGASTGPVALRHGGREYVVILEGVARFEIGFQHYTLYPGDSITFDSSIPHRTVNVGDTVVRGIHFMLDCNR